MKNSERRQTIFCALGLSLKSVNFLCFLYINSIDTLANYKLADSAYSALFLPSGNNKIIVCGGK